MYHFNGAGKRQNTRLLLPQYLSRSKRQYRTDSFAAGKKTVAHRLVYDSLQIVLLTHFTVQIGVYQIRLLMQDI